MSIKDIEKSNTTMIESLKRKQNRELSRMREGHETLKTEIKGANNQELVEIEHDNVQKLTDESFKKEKVLIKMKDHLDTTRKMTDREIADLKTYASKTKKEEYEKLSAARERTTADNDLHLEDVNYRFEKENKKINHQTQSQLSDTKRLKGAELTQTENFYQDKINTQTNQFNEKYQSDNVKQKKIKDDLEKQFKTERAATNIKQQTQIAKLTGSHNTDLENRDTEYRRGLKEQELLFEKKYKESLETRAGEFSRLEELNTKVLSKVKGDLSETLKTTVNRSDDPFYSFIELKPSLKQFESHVEIKVAVPAHAKTDLQLTINGKEAVVNFNRRYDDNRKVDGGTNKLHKVESYTSRLLTQIHLDPKSVKSSFEDGVMTYTIQKS